MSQVVIGIPFASGVETSAVPYKFKSHSSLNTQFKSSGQVVAGKYPPTASRSEDISNQNFCQPISPKVIFISETGSIIRVPFAPSEVQLDRLAPVYSTIERPGKQELLLWEREQLPQVTLTVFIAAENQAVNPLGSVEEWITSFRRHISSRTRWRFQYGPQVQNHWWRFTDVSIKSQIRTPNTNEIAVATADIQLTKASDVNIRVGPVTGGVPAAPTPPGNSGNYTTYTIKSASDTLWTLAVRFLGDGNRWKEIAKLNNISDVRKIKVGQTIKIPGK